MSNSAHRVEDQLADFTPTLAGFDEVVGDALARFCGSVMTARLLRLEEELERDVG